MTETNSIRLPSHLYSKSVFTLIVLMHLSWVLVYLIIWYCVSVLYPGIHFNDYDANYTLYIIVTAACLMGISYVFPFVISLPIKKAINLQKKGQIPQNVLEKAQKRIIRLPGFSLICAPFVMAFLTVMIQFRAVEISAQDLLYMMIITNCLAISYLMLVYLISFWIFGKYLQYFPFNLKQKGMSANKRVALTTIGM